jgi:uncharacterized protein involved in high-affinity Fe2+ transport
MIRNIILSATLLSAALALSMLAKADLGGAPAFAQSAAKMHLDQGIKALESGDNQGAKMHLDAADQALSGSSSSDQSAKMHLDQGIKALESGDNQGAKMHLNAADQALGGSSQ